MKRIAVLFITAILLAAGCEEVDANQGISEPSSSSQALLEATDEHQLPDYLQAYKEFLWGGAAGLSRQNILGSHMYQ